MVQPTHTYHACSFCRSKRTKCDGENPCGRCRRLSQDCIYRERTKESKGDLRKQRDELQVHNRDAETILRALRTEDSVAETLASLQSRAPIGQIASSLRRSSSGGNHDSFSSRRLSTDEVATSTHGDLDKAHMHSRPNDSSHGSSYRNPTTKFSSTRDDATFSLQEGEFSGSEPLGFGAYSAYTVWGIVGLDLHQIHDLLNVFFDWQYIPLLSVDKDLLVQDFAEGRERGCSPALIRAILCLACRSLSGYDKASSFHVNLGDRLLHEGKEILRDEQSRRNCLPNAQALSLLAVHQLGSHDKSDALDLIEECVRMLASLNLKETPVDQMPTLSWTSKVSTCLHGALSLARMIRLYFEYLPSPSFYRKDVNYSTWNCDAARRPKESVLEMLRTSSAIEHSDESNCVATLLVTTTSSVYCFLSTLAKPSPDEYPNELFDIYQTCLSQCTGLIAALQTLQVNRTSLTFTHLVYHFSLLSLCRPFCHVATQDTTINFRAICLEAAQAILSLSASSQDLISSHQLPCFVPLFVHAAALVSMDLAVSIVGMPPPSPMLLSEGSSTGNERAGSSTRASFTTMSSDRTSPHETPASLFVTGEKGKSKFDSISVSPFPTFGPKLASPGVNEALDSLDAMGSFFPVSRDAKDHLQGLLDAAGTQQEEYGFPSVALGGQEWR